MGSERDAYCCCYTRDPVRIDGVLDEAAWKEAEPLTFTVPETHREPISKTDARVLYDRNYVYLGFKAYDQDLKATYTQRDSRLWEEDVLEAFFKTDAKGNPYYEFEFSPLGTIFDALFQRRNAPESFSESIAWNCTGLKVATKVKGTLNNPTDRDEYWTLEVAIPFAELPTLHAKPPSQGDAWLFHLARYDYSAYLPQSPELSSCARLSKPNYHLYEDWMNLLFS